MNEQLLTPEIVAQTLQVSVLTLRNWRHKGFGPTYIKFGGLIRYKPGDLERWVTEHRRTAT
jgi:predicted site-specific integrase-resolvase